MDKQQIIDFIKDQLSTGKISTEDLILLTNNGVVPSVGNTSINNQSVIESSHKSESSKNLINIFYVIGAIIALVGVVILVLQNWVEIGFTGRLLVTLGISLITYIIAFLLNKPHHGVISQVMFTISSALAPLGTYVLLQEANIDFAWPYQFYTACALSIVYGFSLWATRKNILVLITIGFASWAYFSLLLKIFEFNYYSDMLKWSSMLLGLSYILIAYAYQFVLTAIDYSDEKEKTAVRNVLYGLGTLAILGAGISIGGVFDLMFIILIFGAFYGSIFLKSSYMLALASLFLMAHIIKLTSKYFVDSIGWSVSLIFAGFAVIGIGYMSYNLNKKYISRS